MIFFRMPVLILFAAILCQGTVYAGSATGMRCGNDLASINDAYFTVINKCGTPCYEEDMAQGDNKTYSGKKVSYYCINEYTYILSFQNSVLVDINSTHNKCKPCDKK